MNGLQNLVDCLEQGLGEIHIDEPIRVKALGCIDRMLAFTAALKARQAGSLVPGIGAA